MGIPENCGYHLDREELGIISGTIQVTKWWFFVI
jgi:hypothetical protein